MAGIEVVMGNNARFYVGPTLVACATDFKLTIKAAKLSTVCQGSGDADTAKPGNKSYAWDCGGLVRQYDTEDEEDNISPDDWIDAIVNDTQLTIKFEGNATGDRVHTLIGFMENYDETHKVNEISNYKANGWGNSYTKTAKSA